MLYLNDCDLWLFYVKAVYVREPRSRTKRNLISWRHPFSRTVIDMNAYHLKSCNVKSYNNTFICWQE